MKFTTVTRNVIQVMDLDDEIKDELLELYNASNDSSFSYTMEYNEEWDEPWVKQLLDEYVAAGGKEGDSVLMEVYW